MTKNVKKKRASQQAALLDGPSYGWKNVQEVEFGDSIVVAEQEALVTTVR